jgi:hypothetical protein
MGVSAYRRVLGTAGNVSYSDGARRKAGGGATKELIDISAHAARDLLIL